LLKVLRLHSFEAFTKSSVMYHRILLFCIIIFLSHQSIGQPGSLDSSFGINGKQTYTLGFAEMQVVSTSVQGDGKILLAGYASYSNTRSDIIISRLNTDGSTDLSFGNNGIVTTDILSGSDDLLTTMQLQTDGKIYVAGNGTHNFIVRYLANGSLDNSFDGDGKLLISGASGFALTSMIVQSDGKIVVVGQRTGSLESDQLTVYRFIATGGLDNSFDFDGVSYYPYVNINCFASSVLIQNDGKYIISCNGTDINTYQENILLARLETSGQIDLSFGSMGWVKLDPGSGYDEATDLKMQEDGKILVSGYGSNFYEATVLYTFVMRVLPTGGIDTGFDSDGLAVFLTTDGFFSLGVFQINNKALVFAGVYKQASGYYSYALGKLLPNGSRDLSFGLGGIASAPAVSISQYGLTLSMQQDGKYIIGGAMGKDGHYLGGIMRMKSDGSIDLSLNETGFTTIEMGNTLGKVTSTNITGISTGGMYSAGTYGNGFTIFGFIEKTDENGMPDPTFGDNGRLNIITPFLFDLRKIYIQPDGKILVAGNATDIYEGQNLCVMRFNANGSPDLSFGVQGKRMWDVIGNISNELLTIGMQSDGKIIVLGAGMNFITSGMYMMRLLSDGTLDNGFGNGGKVSIDFDINSDEYTAHAQRMVIQPDDKVIVVGTKEEMGNHYVAMRRFYANGEVDPGFNAGAIVLSNINGKDFANLVALQSDGKILVSAQTNPPGNRPIIALMRYLPGGLPDNTFGAGGKILISSSWETEQFATALQISSEHIIVGATIFIPSIASTVMAAFRLKMNGMADSSFGINGISLVPLTGGFQESAMACLLLNSGQIILCGKQQNQENEKLLLVKLKSSLSTHINPFILNKSNISIYPNPVMNETTLKFENMQAGLYQIRITNMEGKQINIYHLRINSNSQQLKLIANQWPDGILIAEIEQHNFRRAIKVLKISNKQ